MNKSPFLLSILLIAFGLICIAAFSVIGSSVDQNGILQEPFALLPVGYSSLAGGIVTGAIAILKMKRRHSGK